MTRVLVCFLLAGSLPLHLPAAPAPKPGPGVFFVSPRGNDQWSGSRPSPNWGKTDGPFATLPRAVAAAREWRQKTGSTPGQPVSIFLREGRYVLAEPLVLKPEDSGLALSSFAGEKPVVSGGRRINDWKAVTIDNRKLWAATLPEVRDGKWFFRELWVNGQRAVRARHPNQGYFKVAGLLENPPEWIKGQTQFAFHPGDLPAWKTATEAEVVVMSRWVESRLPVFSVDDKDHIVSFNKRSVFHLDPGDPYYLEGAFEALDQPGEWYLDRAGGTLYYEPRPGESLKNVEAIAPVLTQVVRVEGRPESGQFVETLVFRGLTFSHTEWCFPQGFNQDNTKPNISPPPEAEVGGFGQAAIGVPGAVWGQGVRECAFENCAFIHIGDYGLELARGCQQNRLTGCDFSDLGAGGIKIGETAIRNLPADQTRANEVSNCAIHDGGKMFHSAIGIWVGQSPDNRLTHNLIHDFYYTGISIGWTWGYGPALATNNLVAFNHVHHIGVRSDGDGPILSDMGGIYTLGMQPGTRVLNNLWHDIAGLRYGGWGIYFDEGSSSIVAQSNVVYRTTHGGFHQHYGATNVVENNVFAFARDHQLQRTRLEPHTSFTFATNIVYFDTGVVLGGNWSNDHYQMDWNVYFDARPDAKPLRFENASLEEWRARGHDEHSLIADPLFLAPSKNDFHLQSNSPALKLGFQPIDLTQAGIRKGQ
ncbi:MAG TPA: right-handed parallel beta-helix repeat-containing protein [Candidatus Acidoferrum sp.]|jgi:hypothetical protein|nr:right-handed parallel beta-helix repeat-containing protein [Candidatus Acidoferrum sp.]